MALHLWRCPKCSTTQKTDIKLSEAGHRCPRNRNAFTLFTYVPPAPKPEEQPEDEPVFL